jgi:curli biogenesis system outer membrane secretion channel CsgG
MRQFRKWCAPLGILALLLLFGCATAIPIKVTKAAEINLRGAKTLAVLPISFPSQVASVGLSPYQAALLRLWFYDARENQVEKHVAQYAENIFTTALLDTQYFTVLRSEDLKNTVAAGDANAKINADVVITGALTSLNSQVSMKTYTNKDTGKRTYSWENRIALEVRFDVIQTATSELIAVKTFSGTATRTANTPDAAEASTEEAAKAIIKGWAEPIKRALAPYVVTEARFLADDELKDPRMEQAKKLVQDQFYQKAFEMYTKIYADSKNFAGGFNAAIMKEVLGDLEGAIADMSALADASTNPRALQEVKRMNKALEERQKLEAQKQGV